MEIGRKSDLEQRIRDLVVDQKYLHNQRLPPERDLCTILGVTRSRLRTALSRLEDDGLIWRHVGRGTFVGARPVLNLEDVELLRDTESAEQILESRIAIEPALAGLAAIHALPVDIEAIKTCAARCRRADEWRGYEAWDNKLHDAVAIATHNKVLIYLFETLNVVRRSILWGQERATVGPPPDHTSFTEHDHIVAAVIARDAEAAQAAMRTHLISVRDRVLTKSRP